jgi:hypothetical protein
MRIIVYNVWLSGYRSSVHTFCWLEGREVKTLLEGSFS